MLSYNKSSINKQLGNLPQDFVEHRGAAIDFDLMGRCSKACPRHPFAPAILQEALERMQTVQLVGHSWGSWGRQWAARLHMEEHGLEERVAIGAR